MFDPWVPDFARYQSIVDRQQNPGCCTDFRDLGAAPRCPVCARYRPVNITEWRTRKMMNK